MFVLQDISDLHVDVIFYVEEGTLQKEKMSNPENKILPGTKESPPTVRFFLTCNPLRRGAPLWERGTPFNQQRNCPWRAGHGVAIVD